MPRSEKKVALVTGANKGIGFELARQLGAKSLTVIVGARDEKKGEAATDYLKKEKVDAHFQPLDVANLKSIDQAIEDIREKFGRLDILVNNAGVFLDQGVSALEVTPVMLSNTLRTNVEGPFYLCQRVIPMMVERGYGRIVNLSSGLGSLTAMAEGRFTDFEVAAYRVSKVAINGVTSVFAMKTRGSNILVNSCCPGWVKTDMGGEAAPLSVKEGADTPVWLATLPDGGPSGGYFEERKSIPW